MADDDPDALQACWEALAALQSIIPKEIQVCAGPRICTDWARWLLQRLHLPVVAMQVGLCGHTASYSTVCVSTDCTTLALVPAAPTAGIAMAPAACSCLYKAV